jgi:hypothetical protein
MNIPIFIKKPDIDRMFDGGRYGYLCQLCMDVIASNHSRMIYCYCGKLAIDGNGYYCRVMGNHDDYKTVSRIDDE